MVLVGGATLLAMPVTGTVVVRESDHTADVLVRLARTDDRIRAALLAILRYGTFLELVTIVGSIGLAVNVDIWLRENLAAQRDKREPRPMGIPPNNPAVTLLIGQSVNDVIAANNESAAAVPAGSGNGQQPAGWATAPSPAG